MSLPHQGARCSRSDERGLSKEALRRLWHYVCPESGWKFWKREYYWATHSRLEPIRKAAETVHRHIDNILTYYHIR